MRLRLLTVFVCSMGFVWLGFAQSSDRPNILWISSEDHGPHLGCYGDEYATTPNLDRFSENALRYTKASSIAPVCAAARTTLISGMYAPSLGAQHMRSRVDAPPWVKFLPVYLREAGYYTTNNSKEDYNLVVDDKGWDDSSTDAHWRNRTEGQPFFAVFNAFISHESQMRNENPNPKHDPALAPLPPYHPDIPEVRREWAQYYDRISQVDTFFAERLKELEAAGLAEDTIVFFWADHGSGMPRSKRYPGWSGLHVPMLIHVPERFKDLAPEEYLPGGVSDRLVGFVDFAPTILSIAGIEPPDYHQGHAFMGKHETERPKFSFGFRGRMDERPDFCRTVTDGRYMYIRNFYPHLPHGQYVHYQQQSKSTRRWYEIFNDGKLNEIQSAFWKPHPPEELFDLESDPHETVNLVASEPDIVEKLRAELLQHMTRTRDLGVLPEPLLREVMKLSSAVVDGVRQPEVEEVYFNALTVLNDQLSKSPRFDQAETEDEGYAYWKYVEFIFRGGSMYRKNEDWLIEQLDQMNETPSVPAAEAIALHTKSASYRQRAIDRLIDLSDPSENELTLAIHALNALDHIREKGLLGKEVIEDLSIEAEDIPGWAETYLPNLLKRFE